MPPLVHNLLINVKKSKARLIKVVFLLIFHRTKGIRKEDQNIHEVVPRHPSKNFSLIAALPQVQLQFLLQVIVTIHKMSKVRLYRPQTQSRYVSIVTNCLNFHLVKVSQKEVEFLSHFQKKVSFHFSHYRISANSFLP